MSIADKLQTLAENEQRISNEVGDQADLIAQISSVIDEKLAGGGEEPVNKLAGVVDGSITELTAEDLAGAKKIRERAFHRSNLRSIEIPDGVKQIESYAFYYCESLTRVVIPNSVYKLMSYAFQYCTALPSVAIPPQVDDIGGRSFQYCYALKRVDLSTHTSIPYLGNKTTFEGTHSTLQIKVPANLIDEWKTATNWSDLADKIVTEFTNEV